MPKIHTVLIIIYLTNILTSIPAHSIANTKVTVDILLTISHNDKVLVASLSSLELSPVFSVDLIREPS